MQLRTALPSMLTVQAPQSPVSQLIFVPVRPSSSRRTRARVHQGSTRTSSTTPLIRNSIGFLIAVPFPDMLRRAARSPSHWPDRPEGPVSEHPHHLSAIVGGCANIGYRLRLISRGLCRGGQKRVVDRCAPNHALRVVR